jgi:hypothetical protein
MAKEVVEMPAVTRTGAGLREALFDELDNLRSGKTNAANANATSKLAGAIVDTVTMEMEVHKVMSKMPAVNQSSALPTLTLGRNGA